MWESLASWVIKAFLEMLYGVIKGAASIEVALSKENSRLKLVVTELNESIAALEASYARGDSIPVEEIERLKNAGDNLNSTFF